MESLSIDLQFRETRVRGLSHYPKNRKLLAEKATSRKEEFKIRTVCVSVTWLLPRRWVTYNLLTNHTSYRFVPTSQGTNTTGDSPVTSDST